MIEKVRLYSSTASPVAATNTFFSRSCRFIPWSNWIFILAVAMCNWDKGRD